MTVSAQNRFLSCKYMQGYSQRKILLQGANCCKPVKSWVPWQDTMIFMKKKKQQQQQQKKNNDFLISQERIKVRCHLPLDTARVLPCHVAWI